ncbi:Nn.00g084100.m01.CDS01 [Neocucurbitaria sp. VM-36]
MRLQRRAQFTTAGYIALISLGSLAVCGLFCAAVFFLVCKKQRAREKLQRRMQEERRPFVPSLAQQHPAQQYPVQQNPQIGQPYQQPYQYDGPIELQGNLNPGQMHGQVHQLDVYPAPAKINNGAPMELPSYGVKQ